MIVGQLASTGSRASITIPKSAITTSQLAFQLADESYYYSFNLYVSSGTVYLSYKGRNSSGQILAVYGIN